MTGGLTIREMHIRRGRGSRRISQREHHSCPWQLSQAEFPASPG
jgi:hypothetical protein